MNITFLIGNGFDIGLGMKSSFKDFFQVYLKEYELNHGKLDGLAEAIQQDKDTWSYFEKQLGNYTEKFTIKNINEFKNQVKDFEVKFMKYLIGLEQKLDFSDKERISKTMINGINGFYLNTILPVVSSNTINSLYNKCKSENHEINFINFNYTDCLENCLKMIPDGVLKKRNYQGNPRLDRVGKVVHVHGFKNNNPIMGLNDVSQISNQELIKDKRFVKCIVKPIHNEAIKMNYDNEATNLIDQSIIICVYGMSLGETDKKWWQKLLKWLVANENRQLVIFTYDDQFETSSQFDWIDKEDDIIENLASFSHSNSFDIEVLRNRIHIAIHKNIFEMNLTDKEEAVAASTKGSPVTIV